MSPVEKEQTLTSSSIGSSLNKIPHSQSTPGVSGSKTPPTTPRRGGKMLNVRVQMLDDSVTLFQVQIKADGSVLFEQVCKQLNLLEADYFGLEYQEGSTKHWLDLEKPLNKQIGLSLVEPLMRFCVKFYTPDPAQLEEEYTRYLFCLQVKRDLAQGHMQCNDNTAALMASYIVQAECGDYSADDYPDHTYLSSHKFVPHQDREMEIRIMENHKRHIGQSPAEADLNLLETARRCELYGVKMHSAKDPEGVPLNLSVAHMGVLVFQNYTKINTFSWAKIRKLSFKRKKFLIKLHPEGYGYFKDIVEFIFETRNDCKSFWKKCVENHGFFRCFTVKRLPRHRTKVLSRGSSFRYSGKTQKQMVEFVRENFVKRQTFQRSQSFRHTGMSHSTISNVGSSISAHPLLPLANSEATSLAGSLSPNVVHLQRLSGEVLNTQAAHPTTVTTTTSDITSITSSQHSYSVNDPGQRHFAANSIIMYPNIVCNRPCTRVHVIRSNYYDDEYDTDKSYISSKHSESFRDIRCQSSQTDLILIDKSAPSLYSWQRSSSCKDFNLPKVCPEVSSPANIDEINLSFDRNSSLDNTITKIFSSSYPGTTSSLSTESGSDRKIEKLGIIVKAIDPDDLYQDDVSQDSYELLEKEEVFDIHVSDEDEIFYVDSDNREHSQEIEKRLGYMEPKYRDIEFNKFNEICKKELASRSKEQIFSNHTIQFIAFENKSQTAAHLPVERTKSDSYMSVSKPKSHKLLHQKSIDLTPIESFEPIVSNFGMDISYTLHKRHTHEKGSPERDSVAKWSGNHFSQDSGLSLSMQSTSNLSVEDDSPIDLDTLLLNKYHDTVVTTSKSSELIQMAYKSVSLNESEVSSDKNLTDDKPNKLKSCHSAESMSLKSNNKQIHYQPLSADTANHRKSVEVIKINSTENINSKPEDIIIVEYRGGNKGKKLAKDELRFNRDSKSSSYGGKIVEKNISKSPSNIFRTSAIKLKTTSALVSNNNSVHIVPNVNIVEESSNNRSPIDYNCLPDIVFNSVQCSSVSEKADKNIIELIGSKNNILSKKDEEQVVPNEVMNTNEIHSMSTLKLKNALSNLVSGTNNPNYSEQNISESKTAKINRFQTLASKISAFDAFANTVKITEKSSAELPRKNVPNKMLQNREKSPVLYARLGLSDGSMFPTVSGVQLSVQRRAISLDSPVVSLHHLPLATSFSSKDDTVADIEDSAKLEIKPIIWWNDNEVDQMIVECIAEIVEITVANQVEQKRDSGSSLSPDKMSERRRSSTRQERLDSFKKLKNFEIEIWDSDELNAAALIDYEHKDFEDETFDIPIEVTPIECSKLVKISDIMIASPDNNSVSLDESGNGSSEEIPFKELNSQSSDDTKKTARKNSKHNTFSDLIKAVEKNNLDDKLNEPLTPGSESKVEVDQKVQNQKNYQSFLSTEDIINHTELINKLGCIEISPKLESKRHRLSVESSGSSSLDDPLHIDDLSGNIADEEDVTSSPLPPLPDSTYSGGMYLIGYGMYGMSRTLSRISEQSTSERSEIDDELSTKHSTQSASLDDSILSSDYCQPSLCSDAMDSLPDLPPLPEEYAFDIPPPAVDDVEWPSPKSEEKTPIPQQQQRNLEEDEDDAKTIHSDDEPDKDIDVTKEKSKEVEALYRSHYTNKPRLSLGDDTSAGVSTSEFSSNATIVCPFDNVCPPSDYLIREDYSDEYDSPFTEESDESKFYRPPAHLFELPKTTNIRIKGRLSHGPASLDVTTNTSKLKGSTKTRCHSYFSLARSPPSDASSSSLDAQDPLNVPNTIPRASKKRRYTHTLRRKIKAIQITKV